MRTTAEIEELKKKILALKYEISRMESEVKIHRKRITKLKSKQ